MNNYGIVNITPSTTNQIYNGGYYNSINIGAVTSSIDANITSQNIVNGVNILGVVGSFEGLNTADANATYNDIIIGKTAYVNGVKITGSMNNLGALNITPSTSAQSFSAGYYNSVNISAVTSNIDNNIVPNYILNGINILGVTGNFEGGTNTSDANAVSSDILINKTAYVNGTKLTGTMSYLNEINTFDITMNSGTNAILFNGTNISSNGYINNSSVFSMNISNSDLANYIGLNANVIANGVTILDITGVYEMDSDTMNLIQNQANMINSLESQLANLQNTLNTKGTAELNQEEYEEVVDTANDILGEEESE